MKKHNTLKKLKKATALLLSALTLVSALPANSVNAYTKEIKNTGVSTDFGTVSTELTDADFGHYKVGGMRCYIYDKKTGEFISSESNDDNYKGKQAIDFLGFDGFYNYTQSNVNREDIDYNTIFETIPDGKLALSADWPFDDHYFAKYDGSANTTYSGTQETNNWLRDNNAEKLRDIIKTYWGESIVEEFFTSETMLWGAEPLFIISEAYGGEVENPEELGTGNYYKSGKVTKREDVLHTQIEAVDVDDVQYHTVHKDVFSYKIKVSSGEEADTSDTLNFSSDGYAWLHGNTYHNFKTYFDNNGKEHAGLDQSMAYNDLLRAGIISDLENLTDDIDHYDVLQWHGIRYYDVPLYRAFRYVYGTARNIYERDKAGAKFPDRWAIEYASCNAVYVGGVGENGEYNSEFEGTLVFPDNPDMGNSPTYNGQSNCLEVDGVPTTWGFFMLSSLELGSVQWHTNNPLKNSPSGADEPYMTGTDRINSSKSGGFKALTKVYEVRDRDTGKLIQCQTFNTLGITDIMEIDDESVDTDIPVQCDSHDEQCRKSWFTWIKKHQSEGYSINEDGTVLHQKGTGYQTADWCVIKSTSDVVSLYDKLQDSKQKLLNSPYVTIKEALLKDGASISANGYSNKHNVTLNQDDKLLLVRYIKYVDGSTDATPYNFDTVLTESQLSAIAKFDSTISDTKRSAKMFESTSLSGDSLIKSDITLGIAANTRMEKYIDFHLGESYVAKNVDRSTLGVYKVSEGDLGYSATISRRKDDQTGAFIDGISSVPITQINSDKSIKKTTGTSNATERILWKFGTADGSALSNAVIDTTLKEVNARSDMNSSFESNEISDISLYQPSDNINTESNTNDEAKSKLVGEPDKNILREGVYTNSADSTLNISQLVHNNSGVTGSTQIPATRAVVAQVEMGYSTLENGFSHGSTIVTTNKVRVYNVNSYAQISYSNTVPIVISSSLFAIDNALTNGDKQWNQKDSVLKGGSVYSVGTNNQSQTVNIQTVQMVSLDEYDNSNLVKNSIDTSPETVLNNHNEFKDEAVNKLKETALTQWISDNVDDTSSYANDDSNAVKVSGLTNDKLYNLDNGYTNKNPFNNNIELQSDSKYWFNTSESQKADSALFDVHEEDTKASYFKIVADTDGTLWCLQSNNSDFNNANVEKVLEPNETYEDFKKNKTNTSAYLLDQRTNVIENMLNSIVRNKGNDCNAIWGSTKSTGKWYSEHSSMCLVVYTTPVKIALETPSQRTCVIDPHLQPNSSSKLDMGTLALKSNFTTNWAYTQKLGSFLNQEVYLDKARIMFRSRNIYIPNMSVQDNM